MGMKLGIENAGCPVEPQYINSAIYPNWRIFCNYNCPARKAESCSGKNPPDDAVAEVEAYWAEYKAKNNLDALE